MSENLEAVNNNDMLDLSNFEGKKSTLRRKSISDWRGARFGHACLVCLFAGGFGQEQSSRAPHRNIAAFKQCSLPLYWWSTWMSIPRGIF